MYYDAQNCFNMKWAANKFNQSNEGKIIVWLGNLKPCQEELHSRAPWLLFRTRLLAGGKKPQCVCDISNH